MVGHNLLIVDSYNKMSI